jgi:hypothetical protein
MLFRINVPVPYVLLPPKGGGSTLRYGGIRIKSHTITLRKPDHIAHLTRLKISLLPVRRQPINIVI